MTHRTMTTRKRLLPLAIATTASLGSLSITAQAQSEEGMKLDPVVVSATRSETSVSETARSVTVIDRDQVEQQAKVSKNLSDILAQTVPGMGPSSESVTNYGQTLRGRKFLVLIDGIPQSTPLRDASRGLNSIAASAIERIEVIRGGTAVYGFGAKGGVINVITKEASDETVSGYSQAGVRFSTEQFDDSVDYETEHRVSGTSGAWDYVLSGSYVERGGRFDADGDRIPPNGPGGSQGGLADTTEYDILAKTGFNFDNGDQRLELMLNEFNNTQDSDYTFGLATGNGKTPAVPVNKAPTSAVSIIDPEQDATNARLSYSHRDFAGSSVSADLYYGDMLQAFPRYYYPEKEPYNQSSIESEKLGVRTSVETPLNGLVKGASVTWGADYLADETKTNLYDAGGKVPATSPSMDQDAYAGYAQIEVPVAESMVLRGGVRYEDINVETSTVAANSKGHRVDGGTLDYSEALFNLGAVYFVTETLDVFANFSQGFSVADVGRVIRDGGINPKLSDGSDNPDYFVQSLEAEQFESEAEKVDNYEVGFRYTTEAFSAEMAAFYSKSDGGTTFDTDLNIQKNAEDIWGVEGTADYKINPSITVGGTATWSEGIRDEVGGGRKRLPATRIAPLKLTGYLTHETTAQWNNRLQLTHVGSRDHFPANSDGFGEGEVDRYTVFDYVSSVEAGPGEVSLAVRNLLNKDFYPALSQGYYSFDSGYSLTSRVKGQGRTISLGYSLNW